MHITTGQVLVLICYVYAKELERNVNRLEGPKGDHSVVLVFCDVNIFRLWTPGLALITFISKIRIDSSRKYSAVMSFENRHRKVFVLFFLNCMSFWFFCPYRQQNIIH